MTTNNSSTTSHTNAAANSNHTRVLNQSRWSVVGGLGGFGEVVEHADEFDDTMSQARARTWSGSWATVPSGSPGSVLGGAKLIRAT